jgi:hypothetical protein
VLGCLVVAWVWDRLPEERRSRRLESVIGRQVVVGKPGVPDAYLQQPSSASPVAQVRVQNPAQALAFVLELKQSVPALYEQQKYFKYGVASIFIDTDISARTGGQDWQSGAEGFEARVEAKLMAQGHHALADWWNAAQTIGNAKRHVISCQVLRTGRPPVDRRILERGKVEGHRILLTAKYNSLGVAAGQTVRITYVDQGRPDMHSDGERLPSFQLELR